MAMSKTAPIFEIYTDKKGGFRWRAKARNGNILAAASEGYANKRDAVHCAKLFGYDPTVVPPAPRPTASKPTAPKPAAPKKVAVKAAAPKKAKVTAPAATSPDAAPAKPKRAARPAAPKPAAG